MNSTSVPDYILAYTNWVLNNMKRDGYPIETHKWEGKVLKIILSDNGEEKDILSRFKKKCEGKLDGIGIEIIRP
ncbi:MAG: hypothetical protein JW881_03000 [Spirochaetales bacterium]|nr:hypothetical protein [Spirochaetales bacterium]